MYMIDSFKGEYAFLSNFYPSPVKLEGDDYLYPTVEHAYQAAKTLDWAERDYFKSPTITFKGKIVPLTAGMAKKLGRTITMRSNWEQIKMRIMTELVFDKFDIPELRDKLIATSGQELIEGNWWGDKFWGVCNGEGQNHLGRILMVKRAQLIAEQFYE